MYVAPYQPVFRDGYSPEYPFSEDRDQVDAPRRSVAESRQEEMIKPQAQQVGVKV